MTCDEFKQQAAAYALGALDAAERAACDQHLQSPKHENCVETLRQANETAALLAAALPPAAPDPSTWAQVDARTRQLGAAPARRSTPLVAWLVAAVALILIVWMGRDLGRLGQALHASDERARQMASQRAECVAQLERLQKDAELQRQALALLALPGSKLVAMTQQGAAQANVIYHAGEKRAFMLGHNLSAPTGKDYELWMIRGDKKIPAGILRADSSGALLSAIDPRLLAEGPPDAMAVTLEVTGGRPQPEGPIVLVGKI